MNVSSKIKALLSMKGMKQGDLLRVLGLSSKQSLSNKFTGERWAADDLIKIADYTECKLAFILPDGERLILNDAAQASGAAPVRPSSDPAGPTHGGIWVSDSEPG